MNIRYLFCYFIFLITIPVHSVYAVTFVKEDFYKRTQHSECINSYSDQGKNWKWSIFKNFFNSNRNILTRLSDTSRNNYQLLVKRYKDEKIHKALSVILLLYPNSNAVAQQSLWNIPSINPTFKSKFFFQEQLNFSPSESGSSTTLDYGLGKGWSTGISVYNLNVDNEAGFRHTDPDYLVNLENVISINKSWNLGVGTQSGLNAGSGGKSQKIKSFVYLNNEFKLPQDLAKLYLGYYHANSGFTGSKTSDGFLVGAEIPVIKDKLSIVGDYVSGETPISIGVIGLVWTTESDWQLSVGAQIPAPDSNNEYGVVFEITKPGF